MQLDSQQLSVFVTHVTFVAAINGEILQKVIEDYFNDPEPTDDAASRN